MENFKFCAVSLKTFVKHLGHKGKKIPWFVQPLQEDFHFSEAKNSY